jgi:hypothetical protein
MRQGVPRLSIVITTVSGATHLVDCLAALRGQQGHDIADSEIIVPYDRQDHSIAALAMQHPQVIFHPLDLRVSGPRGLCHEHFDQLRATGLALAHGEIVALLEDHERPHPRWCETLLEKHAAGHAAVGGAVENDIDRALNHATWFLDFGRYQNPLPEGPSTFLTDVNIAYRRSVLERIRDSWERGFNEPDVHSRLLGEGETLWMSPDMIVYQHRSGLTLKQVLRERFVWGRYFAGNRVRGRPATTRLLYSLATLAVPGIILLKKTRDVLHRKRLRMTFVRVLPYILLLTLGWSAGELTGYLTGRASNYGDRRPGDSGN